MVLPAAKLSGNHFLEYGEIMEQIILSANLRFVTAGLSAVQRGELLQALLDGNGEALAAEAQNIYRYIMALQEEMLGKKQRMRELSAKGVAARKKAQNTDMGEWFDETQPAVTDGQPAVTDGDKERKEAKESNYNKIKKLFISSSEKENADRRAESLRRKKRETAGGAALRPAARADVPFVPPLVDEVRAFVTAEGLMVEPETFVDFYDSHGWKVGTTAIKNWKATVRLWHRRACYTCNDGGIRMSCCPHPPAPSSEGRGGGSAGCEGGKDGISSPTPVLPPQGGGGSATGCEGGKDGCCPHPPAPSSEGRGGGSATGCDGRRDGMSSPPPVLPPQGGGGSAGCGEGLGRKREDETYWHELMEKVRAVDCRPPDECKPETADNVRYGESSAPPDDEPELSPFARFMRRIENNDM